MSKTTVSCQCGLSSKIAQDNCPSPKCDKLLITLIKKVNKQYFHTDEKHILLTSTEACLTMDRLTDKSSKYSLISWDFTHCCQSVTLFYLLLFHIICLCILAAGLLNEIPIIKSTSYISLAQQLSSVELVQKFIWLSNSC